MFVTEINDLGNSSLNSQFGAFVAGKQRYVHHTSTDITGGGRGEGGGGRRLGQGNSITNPDIHHTSIYNYITERGRREEEDN